MSEHNTTIVNLILTKDGESPMQQWFNFWLAFWLGGPLLPPPT